MKKNKIYVAVVLALVAIFALTAGIPTLTGIGNPTSIAIGTTGDDLIDTVKWTRESGVVGLAFGISFYDSANVKNIVVKRVVNGSVVSNAVAVADTIAGAAVSGTVPYGADSATGVASFNHAVTMTPYADAYWFLVKYNNTATQATWKNGNTTTVRYEVIKQYSK